LCPWASKSCPRPWLHAKFVHYFAAENISTLEQNAWIRNLFQADITKIILFFANEEKLTDLSYDENPMGKFSDSYLTIRFLFLAQLYISKVLQCFVNIVAISNHKPV